MPMKEWIYRMQPVQLYIVLAWSSLYFAVQLFLSHVSHSMVLLVASYHMLCNIIALTGCILTIKKSAIPTERDGCRLKPDARSVSQQLTRDSDTASGQFAEVPASRDSPEGSDAVATNPEETALEIKDKVKVKARQARESTLKNTFGWTRIDILTMLVVCIFMASFCFSAVIEALQTLSHIHHQDAMHFPVQILILGAMGLILNGMCYLLIGGYTYHQGSFLYITSSGNVILDHSISGDGVRKGDRRLSGSRRQVTPSQLRSKTKRQSVRELMRDICSTVIVIICSLIVYCTTEETAKFVDPALSILSCIILLTLSYPYMKESGMILLQTIPDTIDIEIFKKTLLDGFKDIVSVHDLHIWQLSGNQYVSTVHIIFDSPKVYLKIHNDVIEFFHEQGINQVTIQPEFKAAEVNRTLGDASKAGCLIQCRTVAQCASRQCCDTISQEESTQEPLLEVVDLPRTEETTHSGEKIALGPIPKPADEPSKTTSIDSTDTSSTSQITVKEQTTDTTGATAQSTGIDVPERNEPSTGAQEGTGTTTVQINPVKTESEQQQRVESDSLNE
ncbi:proton-coupled zinc antiporter SLC30A1 [Anopheles ziemanni]|uniref:proton-coupled zinc antiporter SLC30A1 n=1 Tax=Anopheles coustani TaxID=139045 RepID=UPI0026589F9C|nr:proton-coupled zinc antiporter SLC30A1 [Anopheles coustani]XP_058170384.1 proton-coupled zinc antiporter SLC30A1 [Anopheles ziemanni]